MSTSKIGRAIRPKTKVNPDYGKQPEAKKEEVDKLEVALTTIATEMGEARSLVVKQSESLDLILKKLQSLETRIYRLEEGTKSIVKTECEELKSSISQKLDSLKEEDEEAKKAKKWFK